MWEIKHHDLGQQYYGLNSGPCTCSTTYATLWALFVLVIFEVGSHFWTSLDCDPLILGLLLSRGHHTHPFICWDRVLWTFCLNCLGTPIFQMWVFKIVRSTSVSHWGPALTSQQFCEWEIIIFILSMKERNLRKVRPVV
jgi:hypothetical protein